MNNLEAVLFAAFRDKGASPEVAAATAIEFISTAYKMGEGDFDYAMFVAKSEVDEDV